MPAPDRTFPLPKELSEKSAIKALAGIAYSFVLFFLSWFLVGLLWSQAEMPLWMKVGGALPLLVLGGYGMLLMGFMGHDGTHFTLHDNKIISCVLGVFVTAPVFPYLVMGFTISHWNHHKFTNSELDPDAAFFSKFKNLFSRAFLARPASFWEYGSNTVRLALAIPLRFAYQFPLPKAEVQRLAILNVLLSLVFGALYLTVALAFPVYGLALGVLYLFGTAISGLSPFVEHTGTDLGRGHDTRTALGLWWDVLILGNNYHIEHHLYPTVPFYNLKRVHRHLVLHGYYMENRFVSTGVWDTYRFAISKYPYPNFSSPKKP